ncbi:hypothetical protein FNV43_RR09203 [Rhamnella rubrinervis]|uniref:Transcriptional regulator SLK2 n=1 Tax=Rhamnella rubrinervis TaxID=2594499 RepID=A0A8K0MK48_9ROSA|nr:hypothetical protein FNV43_RR09203 [Rhamnella rubrinervis]
MALKAFLDSNCELAVNAVARSRGFVPSSSSDSLLQKHGEYQAVVASLLNATSGNVFSSPSRISSSSVMDANLAFSNKSPYLYRSDNANIQSKLKVPAMPVSSFLDSSSTAQHIFNIDQNRSQMLKRKQLEEVFPATTCTASERHHSSLVIGVKQEPILPINSTQRHKKPRLEIKEDSSCHQYNIQQLLQSQDSGHLQRHTPQLQALFQNHLYGNQNQSKVSHSIPQLLGVHMQSQQQKMRNQLQQQGVNRVSTSNMHPLDEGVCSRRLMQYLNHLRHRPPDNDLAYWREFVAEYYAPCAKKRWCVSLYDKVGLQAIDVFPHAAMDAWQCEICGCRSGKGFEAIFEVLPRLSKMTFESGVIDELLFLDIPHEYRFPSGLIMLEFEKAVQESVYEQLRVVHEGQLRVVFNQDFKILSWEFCARCHEVFFLRSLVEPQVNQLVSAAQKYQSSIDDSGSESFNGVYPQDLQASRNMIQETGFQFTKALDSQLIDNLGFSKRYTRFLQVADIVNNMKDLMSFCKDYHVGPIESLKSCNQVIPITKLHPEELQGKKQIERAQDMPMDDCRWMATSPSLGSGINANANANSDMDKQRVKTALEHATSALPAGYYHNLMRHNPSSKPFQGPKTSKSMPVKDLHVSGTSSSSECSQIMQQGVIQKVLQEMNSRRTVNRDGMNVEETDFNNKRISSDNNKDAAAIAPTGNLLTSIAGKTNNNLRPTFNMNLSKSCFIKGESDFPGKLYLQETILNLAHGYHEGNEVRHE